MLLARKGVANVGRLQAAWRVLLLDDESLIVAWALTPMMRLMKKVADSSVGLAR